MSTLDHRGDKCGRGEGGGIGEGDTTGGGGEEHLEGNEVVFVGEEEGRAEAEDGSKGFDGVFVGEGGEGCGGGSVGGGGGGEGRRREAEVVVE